MKPNHWLLVLSLFFCRAGLAGEKFQPPAAADVIELFLREPAEYRFSAFMEKFRLNVDETVSVVAQYGESVFFKDSLGLTDPRLVIGRNREIDRMHFAKGKVELMQSFRQERTKLTVAEMAKKRGWSENEVYQILRILRLNLIDAFNRSVTLKEIDNVKAILGPKGEFLDVPPGARALDLLEYLTARFVSADEAAQIGAEVFGFNISALRGVFPRKGREFTAEEAAVRLNAEAYVIPDVTGQTSGGLYDPEYGYLKKRGRLAPLAVMSYVNGHFQLTNEELARKLMVSAQELAVFFETHGITKPPGQPLRAKPSAPFLLRTYLLQHEVLISASHWVDEHNGQLPRQKDFGRGAGKITALYRRVVGLEEFKGKGLFRNAEHFAMELFEYQKSRGSNVNMFEFKVIGEISPELRTILQAQALANIFKWVTAHQGRAPQSNDFGFAEGQIPIFYKRLVSVDGYQNTGVFASPNDLWFQLYWYCILRGVETFLPAVTFKAAPSEPLRAIMRTQVLFAVLSWIRANPGRTLQAGDFGFEAGQIPLYYPRLTSMIFSSPEEFWVAVIKFVRAFNVEFDVKDLLAHADKPAGLLPSLRQRALETVYEGVAANSGKMPQASSIGEGKLSLFDTPSDFWVALYEYCKFRNIELNLLSLKITFEMTEAFRAIVREQVLSLTLKWVRAHGGRLPEVDDFSFEPGKLPLTYERVVSHGKYRNKKGFFASPEEFWLALYDYALRRGVEINLVAVRFVNEMSPQLRRILQKQAVEYTLKWIVEHDHRIPPALEFGFKPGQIPILYERLTSVNNYKTGIFLSPEEFWLAVHRRARERKIKVKWSAQHAGHFPGLRDELAQCGVLLSRKK